jgi:hypothetical protein
MGWLLFKLPISDVPLFMETLIRNRSIHFAPAPAFVILVFATPVIAYHARWLIQGREPGRPVKGGIVTFERLTLGAMLVAIVLMSGEANAFIYFQF